VKPCVGLFTKPVVPGEVKTRLTPPLQGEEAAELYSAFLHDIAAMLNSNHTWDWVVFSTSVERQRETWPSGAPEPSGWFAQRGEDLGERIQNAGDELLDAGHGRVVLLGSDHPTVTADLLESAFTELQTREVVFGPTLDGGYYLVGTTRPRSGIFTGVPWSTPQVLARTLDHVEAAGIGLAMLSPWYDVDTPDDLRFLKTHLRSLEMGLDSPCPRTREVLDELGDSIA
jgi:rSAM/selenodomain-associated transferase 1